MGVGHFDLFSLAKAQLIAPKDVGYKDSIDIIRDELQRTRKSFVKIGWYLKHINEEEMYKEDGYLNIYEFAHDKFNISQSTATRFINLCIEFSIGHDSPELDERYMDFSVSQLFEMLPMKQEEKETVTPDMTVKEIRAIKKEKKNSNETVDVEMDKKTDKTDYSIPGQTSIEKDFPEYMPENNKVSSEQDDSKVEEVIIDEEPKEVEESDVLEEDIVLMHDIGWFVEHYVKDIPNEAEKMIEICRTEDNNTVRAKSIKKYIAPNGYHGTSCSDYSYQFGSFSAGINFIIGNEKMSMTYRMFAEELMKIMNRQEIIDGEYEAVNASNKAEKMSSDSDTFERDLRDEIEELADGVREVFWGWNAAKKMPREEVEAAKENVKKLVAAIDELLNII